MSTRRLVTEVVLVLKLSFSSIDEFVVEDDEDEDRRVVVAGYGDDDIEDLPLFVVAIVLDDCARLVK